ncbi:MAG: ParB/RepB/Spo0J family partition protein [Steroidobacteraceae bacterium]
MIQNPSTSIPLAHLIRSAQNVRISPREDIDALAHSILQQGVLQSLVVTKSAAKGKAAFEVVAGGRRFAALQKLREQGKIKASFEVPCTVIEAADAVAASLSENTQRQPMCAADQFDAFKRLVDGGRSIEDVAALFSVTPLVVKRRLKLANVAPSLIELFRKDALDLEAMMAFAVIDDHERQVQVFESLHKNNRHANWIRQALTTDELPSNDRLVRFVTLKAYEKAGGPVRVDLFSDQKCAYVQDVALLRSLAQAKLDKKVAQVKDEEGAAWAEGRLDCDYSERNAFGRVGMIRKEPSAKVAKQLAALQSEMSALQESGSEEDDYQRLDVIQDQIEEIEQSLEKPDPRAVKLAGILLTVEHDGRVEITRGLIRAEDKKALKALAKSPEVGAGSVAVQPSGEGDLGGNLSGALRLNLSAQFTAGLQARLDASPSVALRALAATLWVGASANYLSRGEFPVTVRGTPPNLRSHAEGIEVGPACGALAASHAAWETQIGVDKNVFATLSAWPDTDVIALLAHCTALNTDVIGQGGPTEDAMALANAAALDMRDFWQPSGDAFLKRVPKGIILDALRVVNPALDFTQFEKAKKGELIAMAEPILVAAKWIPAPLRCKEVAA